MALIRWIRRNPLIATGMCFAIGTIPQWVSSVWSLVMSEPLVPWLIKQGVPDLGFSAWWITAPIGLLMFATVVLIEFKVPYLSKNKLRELQEARSRYLTEPAAVEIDDPRVTYEQTDQIIEIFKNAPQVKVAVTSLSVQAGEEFKPVMQRAGWLRDALNKAGVNATISLWGTLGSVPDGTSIWWIRNYQNNDMVERIIRAAKIKGLHPRPVARPVSAGECEIELMIGRNPTRPS